jgi:two-component system CheB/CheR fusion protein
MIELIEKLLIERFPYSCVIVNENDEIVYVYGKTDKFLELPPGKAALNIIEMAREGMKLEMSVGIRKARLQKKEVVYENLEIRTNGSISVINLVIIPIQEPHPLQHLLLVIFKVVDPCRQMDSQEISKDIKQRTESFIEELQQELKHTKENLQTTIEELETSNEELKSANEELQSSNEELQSTNEEMETSKEELQSVNEELVTVNAELQCKIDELFKVSDDMNNLLASTDIATVFLDKNLTIKKFTPAMAGIMNFINSDIGRSVEDISSNLVNPGLTADVQEVIRNLIPKTSEVMDKKGKWYIQRILPYRTINNVINGVVVTFMDITDFKHLESRLESSDAFARSIVETVKTPLLVLDAQLHIVSANCSFHSLFNTTNKKTKGKSIFEIGSQQLNIPEFRKKLEGIIPEKVILENFEIELKIPKQAEKTALINAHQLVQIGEQSEGILVAFEMIKQQ